MKHGFSILFFIVIIALAACSSNQGKQCDQGVCVEIHTLDTQNQDGSVTAFITVISDTDRNPVGISINGDPGTIFDDPETGDGQVQEGGNLVSWQVNVRANRPVIRTCNVHFPGNDRAFSLRVMATYNDRIRVYNGVYIRLTDSTLAPGRDNNLLLNSDADGGATVIMRPLPTEIAIDTPTPGPTPTILIPPTPPLELLTEKPTSTLLVFMPPLEAASNFQENESSSLTNSYPAP